jgi:L-galactose dehydrogenase
VHVSLERMKTDHLDVILCHDIEFVDMQQIVDETLPAMRNLQKQGKVRFVGVSGYPMKVFQFVAERAPLDVILSYNHYTLQNTMLGDLAAYLQQKGICIMNAAPFSARLLTNAPLPKWHRATAKVRQVARQAAAHCEKKGSDIAKLALQYSILNKDMTTCVVGSANPKNIRQWADWAAEPIDQQLLAEVLQVLRPIHNWFYTEGRPENNDTPVV